ncbi:MAG: trypsin-like peptidase domain-containing protein [Planctomycetota bacterium]
MSRPAAIALLAALALGCASSLPAPLPIPREAPVSARQTHAGSIPLRAGIFVPAASRNRVHDYDDGSNDYAFETGPALAISLLRAGKRTFQETIPLDPIEDGRDAAEALALATRGLDLIVEARIERSDLQASGGLPLFLAPPRAEAVFAVSIRARRDGTVLLEQVFEGRESRAGHSTLFGGDARAKATEAMAAAFHSALDQAWAALLSNLPAPVKGSPPPAPDLRTLAGALNSTVVQVITETTPARQFWAIARSGNVIGAAFYVAFAPLHIPLLGWRRDHAAGTGILLEDGRILTNRHVLEDSAAVRVTFPGGREIRGEISAISGRTDLGLVRLQSAPPASARPAVLGDSDALVEGETVCAIGHPFLLHNTLSAGIVSAAARTLDEPEGEAREISDYIQFDAAVNPGNSGGPLVNAVGDVVGLVAAKVGGGEGLGFAVPASAIRLFLQDEAARKAWETDGIDVKRLDWRSKRAFGLDADDGLVATRVRAGSRWEKAGLRPGDRIVESEGSPPASLHALRERFARGDAVRLEVTRGERRFRAEVGER